MFDTYDSRPRCEYRRRNVTYLYYTGTMTKREVLDILSSISLAPNKKLGQNFLILENFVRKIVDSASLSKDMSVCEIGPGLGALSRVIAPECRELSCVEIDAGFAAYLTQYFAATPNVRILHQDFLKMKAYPKSDVVISNLPYYCASEILFVIAREISPVRICAMMQKEMAERIVAKPGSEHYGAMTVTLSYYYTPSVQFNVPPSAFYPQPDVVSTVVLFTRVETNALSRDETALFHALVKSAFWGRRKTVSKALSSSPHLRIPKELLSGSLEAAGIDAAARGETLSLDDYIRLTTILFSRTGSNAVIVQ